MAVPSFRIEAPASMGRYIKAAMITCDIPFSISCLCLIGSDVCEGGHGRALVVGFQRLAPCYCPGISSHLSDDEVGPVASIKQACTMIQPTIRNAGLSAKHFAGCMSGNQRCLQESGS